MGDSFYSAVMMEISCPVKYHYSIFRDDKGLQDMESCRNLAEERINPIVFNNRGILIKEKIIQRHIFDKQNIRQIDNFMSLGLRSIQYRVYLGYL